MQHLLFDCVLLLCICFFFSSFFSREGGIGGGWRLWMAAVMFCVPPSRHFGLDRGKQNCHKVHNKWTVEQPQAHSVVSFSLLNLWLFWVSFFLCFSAHADTHTHKQYVWEFCFRLCFPQRISATKYFCPELNFWRSGSELIIRYIDRGALDAGSQSRQSRLFCKMKYEVNVSGG